MTLAFVEQDEPAPDAEILQRMRDGDHGAYVVLYERYVGRSVRLAQSILRRGDVDDIVAEVFAAAFAAIRRGKGPTDDFGPYVLSAVRRECYRASRRAVGAVSRRRSPTPSSALGQATSSKKPPNERCSARRSTRCPHTCGRCSG